MQNPIEERLSREPEWMKRPAVSFIFKNVPLIVLLSSIFLLYGFFLSHKIDLVTADLGRHIKNGELLLSDPSVLTHNFYSYTEPEFEVINHHWGSGLLFYLVWRTAGFAGVQFFFILLSFAALAAFLAAARLYAKWDIIGIVALLALPLLAERTEIRPEVFSYLFTGLFFYILCRFREGGNDRKAAKILWLLPLIEILWVNTHIYFLLGPLIFGAFLLESLIARRGQFRRLLTVFGTVILATLFNPFGVKALTAAATIFQNFGYRLAENQPVWFMEKLLRDPNFLIFKMVFGALVLSFFFVVVRNVRSFRLSHFCIAAGMSVMAWMAIRNLTLFAFFAIPILAALIEQIAGELPNRKTFLPLAAAFGVGIFALSVIFVLPRQFPYWRSFGYGLETGNSDSMRFIGEEGVSGPIFNNYDIGGYLIFHLFPKERVFVDNRPEAYPVSFFEDEYIPMQQDDAVWKEAEARYAFNSIIFAYHDATPWGQAFLAARIKDDAWAPVFADEKVLVFLRRTRENEAVIRKLELARETFITTR